MPLRFDTRIKRFALWATRARINNVTRTNIVSELRRSPRKRIIVGRYGGSYIAEAGSSGGDNSSDSSNSTTLRGWLINVRGTARSLSLPIFSRLYQLSRAMAIR